MNITSEEDGDESFEAPEGAFDDEFDEEPEEGEFDEDGAVDFGGEE